jgi:uncharacterized protein DUF3995
VHNRFVFAIPLVIVLGGISVLHAYWALGGKWASAYTVPTVGGRRMFDPTPPATWAVSCTFGIAVILVLGKAGWIGTGPLAWAFDVGIWGLSLVFLLRAVGNFRSFGFFKTVTGTPFAQWDNWIFSPLCLLLAMLAAGLAVAVR